jgi:hypothetical protein
MDDVSERMAELGVARDRSTVGYFERGMFKEPPAEFVDAYTRAIAGPEASERKFRELRRQVVEAYELTRRERERSQKKTNPPRSRKRD